jgi:hypothetical protein
MPLGWGYVQLKYYGALALIFPNQDAKKSGLKP